MRSFNNATSAERIIYGLIAWILNQSTEDSPIPEPTQHA